MAKKPKKKKAQSPTNLALQRPDPSAIGDHSNLPLASEQVDEAAVEVSSNATESPPVPGEEPPAPVPQVEPPPHPAPPPKPVPSPVPKSELPRPVSTIESISNADGEAFSTGDKILVTAPWGEKAIAQITSIYQSPSDTWAQYQPLVEELPTGWSWLGGVCRAESLVRVE